MAKKKDARGTKAGDAPDMKQAAGGPPDMAGLIDLPPEAVKALLKPRAGYADYIEPLCRLFEEHRAELGALVIAPGEIRARKRRFDALAPERQSASDAAAAAAKHLEMVTETSLLQESNIWSGLLEIYGKAKASKNAEVRKGIEAFTRFMSTGPRTRPPTGK